jgi:ribosomal protein L37AE/L43A
MLKKVRVPMEVSCDLKVFILMHGDCYGHDNIVGVFSSDAKALRYIKEEHSDHKCYDCVDETMVVGTEFGSNLFSCPKCQYTSTGGYWTEDYNVDEELQG